MKFISEKKRFERKATEQQKIVQELEALLSRKLTDDEKIKLFRGDILLPIRKRVIK